MVDQENRLNRQFAALTCHVPAAREVVTSLLIGRLRTFRIPIACAFIIGSFVAILPVFGLWMLPVGLLLLAVDVPRLRPIVSGILIRGRRRIDVWRHRGS